MIKYFSLTLSVDPLVGLEPAETLMNGYSIFSKVQGMNSPPQVVESDIQDTHWGGGDILLCRDVVDVLYSLSGFGWIEEGKKKMKYFGGSEAEREREEREEGKRERGRRERETQV